jgi:hypothetical protein
MKPFLAEISRFSRFEPRSGSVSVALLHRLLPSMLELPANSGGSRLSHGNPKIRGAQCRWCDAITVHLCKSLLGCGQR